MANALPPLLMQRLSRLNVDAAASTELTDAYAAWIKACGGETGRPHLTRWRQLRGADKHRLLHTPAREAACRYRGPYTGRSVDELLQQRKHSVEHVLPRSRANGPDASDMAADPLGWVSADRRANSRRSNLPLQLWIDVNGEVPGHYVPPVGERSRLARKWLFLRATYAYENLMPPTDEQYENRELIVALARNEEAFPVSACERAMNEHYQETLGWQNPLLTADANAWYDSEAWRRLVFGDDWRT